MWCSHRIICQPALAAPRFPLSSPLTPPPRCDRVWQKNHAKKIPTHGKKLRVHLFMHGNWNDTRFFPAPLKRGSKNEFEIRPFFQLSLCQNCLFRLFSGQDWCKNSTCRLTSHIRFHKTCRKKIFWKKMKGLLVYAQPLEWHLSARWWKPSISFSFKEKSVP